MEAWKLGRFNVVVPIMLPLEETVFLRLPLPYKVGDARCPGNSDEKLRTEVATYIWLEENCPEAPIPTLRAFGFPDGSATSWAAGSVLLLYVPSSKRNPLEHGYLILSEAKGEMLSLSWEKYRHDKSYRERLFLGLANVTLSLNRTPLSRIASLTLRPNGCVALSNGPLDLHFQMLENEGISSGIPRHRTYAAFEPYISDLISLQDSKMLHQPNSVRNFADGKRQLAALVTLRAVMPTFIRPQYREGPFHLTLTDLDQSNIFVDGQWNIKTIIELEWACARPIEMQMPPFWLTSRAVDGFKDADEIAEYDAILAEYLEFSAAEEKRRNGVALEAPIQRHVWRSGAFWFFHAALTPKGMFNLFSRHIHPHFSKVHPQMIIFNEMLFCYWGLQAEKTIGLKVRQKDEYVEKVRQVFGQPVEQRATWGGEDRLAEPRAPGYSRRWVDFFLIVQSYYWRGADQKLHSSRMYMYITTKTMILGNDLLGCSILCL
ncbi:uncharacterized protein UV8b_07115 [Ustilaginoidea virens]|uniref:Aminoglycoside phosphotransferase domain-containing protein n=1 Tax=Ustilaginoidea virens TaxID=1159556 RepID=A0A8E5HX51_USTVR|nr:uncharacterized protein UV8b_07115 [Ustilaginoidea virens]QUC22874.1 hypothetical protein UV8b_07115 [Ustilaginoidea virens]